MSSPDSNNIPPEETATSSSPESTNPEAATEKPDSEEKPKSSTSQDPRFSRLMKMQSSFVTEESLRSTEERSKPKPPPETSQDEHDDEAAHLEDDGHLDEEDEDFHDDEDFHEDEDLEEGPVDQNEDEPHPPAAAAQSAPEPELEENTEEESSDHRVARLRKLRYSMVRDNEMEVKTDVADSHDALRDAKQATVVCPNCHAEEPRGNKICGQCGARLPNLASMQEQRYNPGTYDKATQKYVTAVKALADGEWSVEEFVEFLEERQETSRTLLDELFDSVEEADTEEWLPEATSLIDEASNMLEESIDVMLFRVQSVAIEYLEEYQQLKESEDYVEPETDEELEAEQAEIEFSIEEKVRNLDFQDQIDSIKISSDQMHGALRLLDEYMRRVREDLEVSI